MANASWVNWFIGAALLLCLLLWWSEDETKQAIKKSLEIVPSWNRAAGTQEKKIIENLQDEFCLYSKLLMQKGLAGKLPIDEYVYLLKKKENELDERLVKFDTKISTSVCKNAQT